MSAFARRAICSAGKMLNMKFRRGLPTSLCGVFFFCMFSTPASHSKNVAYDLASRDILLHHGVSNSDRRHCPFEEDRCSDLPQSSVPIRTVAFLPPRDDDPHKMYRLELKGEQDLVAYLSRYNPQSLRDYENYLRRERQQPRTGGSSPSTGAPRSQNSREGRVLNLENYLIRFRPDVMRAYDEYLGQKNPNSYVPPPRNSQPPRTQPPLTGTGQNPAPRNSQPPRTQPPVTGTGQDVPGIFSVPPASSGRNPAGSGHNNTAPIGGACQITGTC